MNPISFIIREDGEPIWSGKARTADEAIEKCYSDENMPTEVKVVAEWREKGKIQQSSY